MSAFVRFTPHLNLRNGSVFTEESYHKQVKVKLVSVLIVIEFLSVKD